MPNQINEDELQKAIDDITSSAQNDVSAEGAPAPGLPGDPMAAGVNPAVAAAPAPVPGVPAPAAPEVAPMPDLGMPPMPPMPAEMPAPASGMPTPEVQPMIAPPEGAPEAAISGEIPAPTPEAAGAPADAGTEQIKADILRDLSPLMDKMQIEPEKKFHIYKDMMVTNGDKSVIPSAYETAKQIGDEQRRGEALLSLIDAIDG